MSTQTEDRPVELDPVREQARKRIEGRREFASHAVAYVVINAALVGIWAITGGYFWPAWVMGCWGAGLVLHAWDTFGRRPVTDEDIEAELLRRRDKDLRP